MVGVKSNCIDPEEFMGGGSGLGGKTKQTLPHPSIASNSNIFQRELNWGLMTMLELLALADSGVVFEAAVAPPMGVAPTGARIVAHFSRL